MEDTNTIPESELFKKKENILIPDFRIPYKNENDEYFNAFYSIIEKIQLNNNVPREVYINFETAKNVLLYSYYSYRMSVPATLFIFSTLELSMTLRAQISEKPFKDHDGFLIKFKHCFQQKWLEIKKIAPSTAKPKDWLKYTNNSYIGYYVNMRNDLAHGSKRLNTPLETCDIFNDIASIINMLFEKE